MLLYLVRHGQSAYNAEGRIQGQSDQPLSEIGLQQANAIAVRLAGERIAAVYSSDLERARATAGLIAERHGLAVRTSVLLREGFFGAFQGLTHEAAQIKYPEAYRAWREDPLRFRPPGAESVEEVVERARRFLVLLQEQHPNDDTAAVVAHIGTIRGLVVSALGLPAETWRRFRIFNGSLSILEVGDKPELRLLNDTCHLHDGWKATSGETEE